MALGESAVHTSPSHHYAHLRSLHPTRLSSSPVVSSLLYAFPMFPSFLLPLSLYVINIGAYYCVLVSF